MQATTDAPVDLEAEREARAAEAIAGQQDLEGGEVPAEPEQPAAPAPDEIVLRGNAQLGLFESGGKQPTTATLTLRGKTIELEGGTAYKKGTRVRVECIFVVDEVKQKDKIDKATGIVTNAVQGHSAFVEDIAVVEVV